MKISVVIPAHNEEKYIGQSLNSLLEQNFYDFEIVVCLNLCNDKTESIVLDFQKKSPVAIRIVKENKKGVSYARQTGTQAAFGEIIASADADTIYPKDYLSKIFEVFQKDISLVGVYGPIYLCDGPWILRIFAKIFYLPFLYFSKMLTLDNPAGMNFAFKKKFLIRWEDII